MKNRSLENESKQSEEKLSIRSTNYAGIRSAKLRSKQREVEMQKLQLRMAQLELEEIEDGEKIRDIFKTFQFQDRMKGSERQRKIHIYRTMDESNELVRFLDFLRCSDNMTLVQPGPELQIEIRKELNEDVNTRDSDVDHMKEWLLKQPHLPDTWDEHRILTFLRGCKFSLEKCKRKLDMYFTMRTAVPEIFTNRDITRPELKLVVDLGQLPPLPGLTPDGRRVIVLRGKTHEVETYDIAEIMKVVLMIGDIRLDAEETGVAGDIYILDASVATPTHFSKINPSMIKKFLVITQEAYPVKLKQVHVVNASPLVDTIISWVKPFLKEKLKNRIFVHNNMESLHNYIPKDILPEEYGGEAGKLQKYHDEWMEKLKEYTPWFKEQENIKADESKRPGKPTNYDDLFGLDGSFRQLAID
ncbi:hypothetical protein JTB14_003575 [Gonioctena quinquepunctata]|nr:hypothetical protein JTB14_003575 [Gonioctena quinquepunctata]